MGGGTRVGAQGFSGLRARGHQRRRKAKEDARNERKRKGKADDQRRRRSSDRHVVLIGKGERQQRVRSEIGDGEAEQAAHAREKNAFRKKLAHNTAALRAERGADGKLRAAAHAAHQQQVGDIGAGDEKDQRGDPLQQLQVVLVTVLHVLDTAAAGSEHDMGAGKNLLGALIGKCLERRKLLLEQRAGLGLEGGQRGSRLDATDDVGPLSVGIGEVGCADDRIHRIHGKEVLGRIGIDAVPVKSLGRNTNDGGRLGIDVKRASHHARIACIILLPCVIAHHGGNGCALLVVGIHKEAARRRRKTKDAEVVAGDEGSHDGLRYGLGSGAADGNGPPGVAGLHRGQLFELRQALLEHVIGVGGKERVVPVVVPAAVDAAVVFVADADEGFGIGYRQVMEQDGIDQREDGRVGADAEREREQHGNGEPRRLAQLAECITQILQQNSHRLTSTHVDLHRQKACHVPQEFCASRLKSIG